MMQNDPSSEKAAASPDHRDEPGTATRSQWPETSQDAYTRGPVHTTHRGVLITVSARQNERGAWLAEILASRGGERFALPDAEPATPEWLTEAEALRSGVERGRYLVDRSLPFGDPADASRYPEPRR